MRGSLEKWRWGCLVLVTVENISKNIHVQCPIQTPPSRIAHWRVDMPTQSRPANSPSGPSGLKRNPMTGNNVKSEN